MKVDSTSSSSSTSSLGNTALQGFGGLVSGLDRDALIEQLTSGTSNKITKQKQSITSAQWKQEAYRNIIDKTLDLEDNYLMYSSGDSIKNTALYAQNVLTANGDSDYTKYIKASGTSDMTKYLSINGVKQLATSASLVSDRKGEVSAITTGSLVDADGNFNEVYTSALQGKTISFGKWTGTDTNGKFVTTATWTLPSSYNDGTTTKQINYSTDDTAELVDELNAAFESWKQVSTGKDSSGKDKPLFSLNSDGKIQMNLDDGVLVNTNDGASTALAGLGFKADSGKSSDHGAYLKSGELNERLTNDFKDAYQNKTDVLSYMTGKTVSVTYGGTSHTVALLSEDQKKTILNDATSDKMGSLASAIQSNIDSVFGADKITVSASEGKLSFSAADGKTSVVLNSADTVLRGALGLDEKASNKLNLNGSIWSNREKLGFTFESTNVEDQKKELEDKLSNLTINGKKITGITSSATVSSLINSVNKSGAGVKATYLSGTNQFALISEKTGSGREIDLGGEGSAAQTIFGFTKADDRPAGWGNDESKWGESLDGKDAVLSYSYGGGSVTQELTSDTNSFSLDGLSITVSGTFGYQDVTTTDSTGKTTTTKQLQNTTGVTFTASANTDKAAEKIKKFIEDYNAIVEAVNDQITTQPDSDYPPLTEEQEDEMTEKEVEKWNEKAKAGILNGESTIRDFSGSLQGVMTKLISQSGISYDDLKKAGITMSDDYYDGGILKFDEETFKKAMESDPETVSKVIAGGNGTKGLANVIEETLTPYATRYATRNGNSYGRLVEEAGSTKLALTKNDNAIQKSIDEMNEQITSLKELLQTEQDRYINQFTNLESVISKLNLQSSYIMGISS